MINNFELIIPLLSFNSEDEFYFVQIYQRKKDNPGGVKGANNSSRLIKAYYITSIEQFNNLIDEMIVFANYFNARIGINLNKRSFYKTAFNTLQKISEQMLNKDFKSVRRAYNTACGIHNSVDDKLWLLDFDYKPTSIDWDIELKGELFAMNPIGDKVKTILPTKSGVHVITSPFDLRIFKERFPDVEVHKNNPVNVYIP